MLLPAVLAQSAFVLPNPRQSEAKGSSSVERTIFIKLEEKVVHLLLVFHHDDDHDIISHCDFLAYFLRVAYCIFFHLYSYNDCAFHIRVMNHDLNLTQNTIPSLIY